MLNESSPNNLIRSSLCHILPSAIGWILLIFLIHLIIRFGGLLDPLFIPLSMVILWPLPWVLSDKDGRRELKIASLGSPLWFLTGPALAIALLAISAGASWIIFGTTGTNWFVQHAIALSESLSNLPEQTSLLQLFTIATVPAMLFSPIGEEFLYRGYLQQAFSDRYGRSAGLWIQATAFALVHMSHYGLQPFEPALLMVFLPSMLAAGLLFGWIRNQSGSLWPAVVSHSIYNAGLNGIVFIFLPGWL